MPDLESFLISAKNQENLSNGVKRGKKKKNGSEDSDDEVMPSKTGSRSRPGRNSSTANQKASRAQSTAGTSATTSAYKLPKGKDAKIIYPNKKHQVSTRTFHNASLTT
jgi:hypothetical protein